MTSPSYAQCSLVLSFLGKSSERLILLYQYFKIYAKVIPIKMTGNLKLRDISTSVGTKKVRTTQVRNLTMKEQIYNCTKAN